MTAFEDVHQNASIVDYLETVSHYGFQVIHDEVFLETWKVYPTPTEEHFVILWHPKGILLRLDTYSSVSVNGADAYYNFLVDDKADEHELCLLLSSGHFSYLTEKRIWIGHKDARSGLLHHIKYLEKYGKFLSPWHARPFLWLMHYQDNHVVEKMSHPESVKYYEGKNKERIGMFPQEVQKALDAPTQ